MSTFLKIIKHSVLALVFSIPFLVLYVPGAMFFPFITGKNFAFRIITELALALWAVLVIFDKKYRLSRRDWKNWIVVGLAIFILGLSVSSIFGENFYRSFWSNYERMEGLITHLHLFGLFVILVSMAKGGNKEKFWNWLLHASLFASVIVAFYGLLQMAGKLQIHQSDIRLDATLGNASYLAIYMVFHIFLSLFYFFRTCHWGKWFYIPVAVLELIILYNTATRGAILGFAGGIVLASILFSLLSKNKKIKIGAVACLALVIISGGIFFSVRKSEAIVNHPILGRFASISLEERTTQSRFIIWRLSWEGFKEHPVLGWGPENYNLVFNKYYDPRLWRQEPWFDRAHNVFLDRLIAGGIVGLVSYLGLFAAAIWYLWQGKRKGLFSLADFAILTSAFVAYFFHNLFVFDNLISLLIFITLLAFIASKSAGIVGQNSAVKSQNNQAFQREKDLIPVKFAYSVVLFAIAVFAIYFLNAPAISSSKFLIRSFNFAGQGNAQGAFEEFQKAVEQKSFGKVEAREHLSSFAVKAIQSSNIDMALKQKIFNYSVLEMKKQIEQSPNDIRYIVFLGEIYAMAQQYSNASELFEKAVKLSPNKQMLYFELAGCYVNGGQLDKGVDSMKKAFELDPDFLAARKNYSLVLIYADKIFEAEELMRDYGGIIFADERLVNVFAQKNRYDLTAQVWEKLIEEHPDNAQYKVSLAAAYLKLGQREKSIKQIQQAIELDSRFKQQGEQLINDIKAGKNPLGQ